MKSDGIWVSIFRFMMFLAIMIVIVIASLMIYRSNEEGAFQSQCSQIIARSGGLTRQAYITCNELAIKNYSIPTLGGRAPLFWITTSYHPYPSNSSVRLYSHRVNFGARVPYEIYAQLPIYVDDYPDNSSDPAKWGHNPIPNWSMKKGQYVSPQAQLLFPRNKDYHGGYTPFGNLSLPANASKGAKYQHSKEVGVQIKYDTGVTYSQVRRDSQVPQGYQALINDSDY